MASGSPVSGCVIALVTSPFSDMRISEGSTPVVVSETVVKVACGGIGQQVPHREQ